MYYPNFVTYFLNKNKHCSLVLSAKGNHPLNAALLWYPADEEHRYKTKTTTTVVYFCSENEKKICSLISENIHDDIQGNMIKGRKKTPVKRKNVFLSYECWKEKRGSSLEAVAKYYATLHENVFFLFCVSIPAVVLTQFSYTTHPSNFAFLFRLWLFWLSSVLASFLH